MSTDPTEQAPLEPTVLPTIHNPYDISPYASIPPLPPPPPKQGQKGLVTALIILSCLVVVLSGVLFAVSYFSNQQHIVQATPTATFPLTPRSTVSQSTFSTSSTLTPTVLLNRTPASHSGSYFPAFLSSYSSPQAGLPYTSITVYDAFLAERIKMNAVDHHDGWACCIAYQPEGKIVTWEEPYGIVVEIATFATLTETETDANDLLTNSSGFSVYTRNLCLLFYDDSISNTSLADYITAMSAVCT